jgi:hypothetical protein
LFVSLEDPADLVRYRLRNAVLAHNLEPSCVDRNLTILDGTECDPTLAFERNTQGVRLLQFTPAMVQIEEAAKGKHLVVIDNASEAFAANANDPMLVKQFIRRLTRIARANDAGLVLLAHIDKAAARYGASGESYVGTATWNNSVRSRLALIETDGVIELRQEKSNLGPKARPIALQFNESGILVPTGDGSAGVLGADDDSALLNCLSAAIARGESISTARTGPASAFTCAKTLPDLPRTLRRADKFWAALFRLEMSGKLTREDYVGASRKPRQRWIVAPVAPIAPISGIDAINAIA